MTEQNKAIISNRIYFKCKDREYKNFIMSELTYVIEHNIGGSAKTSKTKRLEIIKNYKLLPGDVISIPQGRTDLIPQDYLIVDKRVKNEVPFPKTLLELRDTQTPVYEEVNDTCFINALVGWGKCFAL
jgi:hypothetical protein